MININKDTFLAELNKLLTFMYDSDKRIALSMYEKMFDDGPNDDAVIQYLNSPTRQAVNIAHSYDAKERKESFEKEVKEGDDVPEFVDTIADIAEGIYSLGNYSKLDEPRVFKNQMSIFGDDEPIKASYPTSQKVIDEPYTAKSASSSNDRFNITLDEPYVLKDDDSSVPELPTIKENTLEEVESSLPAPNYPKDSIFNDPFYAKAIRNGAQVPESEVAANPVISSVDFDPADFSIEEDFTRDVSNSDDKALPRKTIVPLLILYTIFAAPLSAMLIVLLLIISTIFMAASAIVIYIGIQALMAGFSNFTVFADIMVVLGTALAIIAVGLLLLWIGIWIIGGAIVCVVKLAIQIGEKLCTKEVKE